jgi:Carboxymuconolactone decarboxylase family
MIKWALRKATEKFERDWNYDASYLRDMIDASPRAAWLFSRVTALSRFRRDVPIEAWCAAGITAVRREDCGPRTQLGVTTKDARAQGETEQRLYLVSAWREAPLYSDRERAALEWTEAVTHVGETEVPDSVFERIRRHFDEAELVALTFAVVAINSWNRPAVSFRAEVGSYQPQSAAHA